MNWTKMTYQDILSIILVILVPVSTIAGAIYIIVTDEIDNPPLYLFLVAIPGALIGAANEIVKVLPPAKLIIEPGSDQPYIRKWEQALKGSDGAVRTVTDIIVPIRIINPNKNRSIDILDVVVAPKDETIHLQLPEINHVQVGDEKKWLFTIGNRAYDELFNDCHQKTIEPKKITDFVIGLREGSLP